MAKNVTAAEFRRTRRSQRHLVARSTPTDTGDSRDGDGVGAGAAAVAPSSTNGTAAMVPSRRRVKVAENADPYERRIHKTPPRRRFRRFLSWLWSFRPWRERTREEIVQMREVQRRRELQKVLQAEANVAADIIINRLADLDFSHKYPVSERSFGIKRDTIWFDVCRLQPDALHFHIHPRLPAGHQNRIVNIIQDDILTELSLSLGKVVDGNYSYKYGGWITVSRSEGARGIPDRTEFVTMYNDMPDSLDSMSVPIGVGANGRGVYRSFTNMIHMLVAGTTGAGKSNAVNVMLTTLIRRNTPEQLRLLGVDLKGGLEFSFYEGVPHFIPLDIPGIENGIVMDRDAVPDMLQWVFEEGQRRTQVLKKAGVKSIGKYNLHNRRHPLPRIMLVIDEWADIKLGDSRAAARAELLLTNICQRFRAVGIHVVVATQTPEKAVLSTAIRNVLPTRLAFNCPSMQASIMVVGNGAAHGLEPEGRAIIASGGRWTEIQTPYIPDAAIKRTVAGVIAGDLAELTGAEHDASVYDVFEFALSNLNGSLSIRNIYEEFAKRNVTRNELLDWLIALEGKVVFVGDSPYVVEPAVGNVPRRLRALTDSEIQAIQPTNVVQP